MEECRPLRNACSLLHVVRYDDDGEILPQFVDPSAPSKLAAFLFLGAVFMFNGTLWCLILVWGAAAISRRLRTDQKTGTLVTRAAGALFIGLGLRIALSSEL